MEDALQQDMQLAEEVMQMRYFAYVYDEMKRDPKTLTKEREEYLEMMERLSQ